jgi:putative phage-type endonuclease
MTNTIFMNDDYIIDKLYMRSLNKSQDEIVNYIYNVTKKTSRALISKDYIINRLNEINKEQEQLQKLLLDIGIEQKTTEWFAARKNMVTASDMAAITDKAKFSSQRDLIIKKCGYDNSANKIYEPAVNWGNKYEPVANAIYSSRYNVKIFDFGLLKHPEYTFFGASPDGISELGVALEFKCPFKRKLDGAIIDQYYYQIQGQLEVCNLTYCDYVECKLNEYENQDDFINDTDSTELYTSNMTEKGIVIEKNNGNGDFFIKLHSPIHLTTSQKIKWLNENKDDGDIISYWKLIDINIIRIKRDTYFFSKFVICMEKFWNKIQELRQNKHLYINDIVNTRKRKLIYDFEDKQNSEFYKIVKLNTFSIQLL